MKASFEHTILLGPQAYIHPITPITQPQKLESQHLCHLQKNFPANKTLKFSYFLRLADRTSLQRGQQRQKQRRNTEENS
jgi:hypothetical protein